MLFKLFVTPPHTRIKAHSLLLLFKWTDTRIPILADNSPLSQFEATDPFFFPVYESV